MISWNCLTASHQNAVRKKCKCQHGLQGPMWSTRFLPRLPLSAHPYFFLTPKNARVFPTTGTLPLLVLLSGMFFSQSLHDQLLLNIHVSVKTSLQRGFSWPSYLKLHLHHPGPLFCFTFFMHHSTWNYLKLFYCVFIFYLPVLEFC